MSLQKEEQEDLVDIAETYSQSSHEEEEEGEEEEEEDDDEISLEEQEEATGPFWKQHLPAMVIAAAASHWYSQYQQISSQSIFPAAAESGSKHAHVDSFRRTANISFCPNSLAQPLESPSGLKLMDFYLPQTYYETLELLYQADQVRDDLYAQQEYPGVEVADVEFDCLREQYQKLLPTSQRGNNIKLKGTTFYFKDPSLEEMYPDFEVDDGAGVGGIRNINVETTGSHIAAVRQRKLQQPPLVFTGFAAKFVNLSPDPVLLWWDGKGGHVNAKKLVGEIPPMESLGTATSPGHGFHVTPIYDSETALQRWVVTSDTALVYFEPYPAQELQAMVDSVVWGKYQRQMVNQAFARDYRIASKRIWLANFPRRFPMLYMHPAAYIGQTHQMGNYIVRVVSVIPRVMVIDNFLSEEECQQVVELSQTQGLEHSTLHSGATAQQTRDLSTRSSSNTWLPRDSSALMEKIYDRTAQVTNIPTQLFQKFHSTSAQHNSIAESLQVVRYKKGGEEYQPHHDFVYPSTDHRYQPTRFATLLMYLNDVPDGGETTFPRAVNNHNAHGLEIQPKAGQAVLFYNLLEDGNVDDCSQHGSNPTKGYEKWLANMWIWDPIID